MKSYPRHIAALLLVTAGLLAPAYAHTPKRKPRRQDERTGQAVPGTRCTRYPSKPVYGRLEVVSLSASDKMRVVLDGRDIGTTDKRRRQTVGTYDVTVRKESYQDYQSQVRVEQDKTSKLECSLSNEPRRVNCSVRSQ